MDKKRPIYITRLREVLDHSGLTTKEAANEFGVAHRTMQSYIAGERRVHKYLRSRIATFFSCDENFLFPPYASLVSQISTQSTEEIEDMIKRRDLLAALGVSLPLALSSTAQVTTETTLRLAHALAHPSRLDESAMRSLEEVSQHAWLLDPGFSRSASQDAVLYIEKQLEGTTSFLSEAPGAFQQRLYTVCGELCMISAWLLRDLNKPDQAMIRHLQALQSAAMAKDYALCADIKSRIALLLIHHEGPQSALPHIEDAARYATLAGSQITPRRIGWINAIAAEVYGGVRDERATLAALEAGEQGLQARDPSDYYATAYSPPVFSGFKAMALLHLERYDEARTEFEQSLATQQMSTYRRSHKTADLSILEIGAGNIDLAARYMSEAADLATEVGSPNLNKHLLKVRKKLLPYLQTCEPVKQLDIQMHECGIILSR